MNDHSWYHLSSPLDWLRLVLWMGSNLLTGVSYFAIPWELRQWRGTLRYRSVSTIGLLFILFIVLCGASHLAMLAIMQTGPWWAILAIYCPMAIVSVLTAMILHRERELIVNALTKIGEMLG